MRVAAACAVLVLAFLGGLMIGRSGGEEEQPDTPATVKTIDAPGGSVQAPRLEDTGKLPELHQTSAPPSTPDTSSAGSTPSSSGTTSGSAGSTPSTGGGSTGGSGGGSTPPPPAPG